MTQAEPLWRAEEAVRATGGSCAGEWVAHGVSIDSRTVAEGDLFVAIKGPSRDGHEYVAAAIANGAVSAVVDHMPEGVSQDAPLLRVDDTLKALEALGTASRARVSARVVAVTGSVGKTGTKEMLKAAFERQARTHASAASYNNLWGVPLSLARMPRDTQFGVFEIGMNHAGEITPLTALVQPDVAIVTEIAPAHAGHFKSVEQIAEAKAEIFTGLRPGGVAIINQDSPYHGLLTSRAKAAGAAEIVGFGQNEKAAAHLRKAVHHAECSCVAAEILGQPITYKVGLPGAHWVMNSLAVLAAVSVLGGDLALAAMALADMVPLSGRGRRHIAPIEGGSFVLIDESYNANPASMAAALANLAEQSPQGRGRRIAVLGEMAELGSRAETYHRDLVRDVVAAGIDLVFCAGDAMGALQTALPQSIPAVHVKSAADLIGPLLETLRAGDVVTVKGSLSSHMSEVVVALLDLQTDELPPARQGGADAV